MSWLRGQFLGGRRMGACSRLRSVTLHNSGTNQVACKVKCKNMAFVYYTYKK